MIDIEVGQIWFRHVGPNKKLERVKILSAFHDLYGRKRVVFQIIRTLEYIGNTNALMYQSKIPPKMVTDCYIACRYSLELL